MYLFTMPINKAQKITFLAAVLAALAVATAAAAGTNLSLVGSTREAQVERVVHLGFEVRAELVRDDGETLVQRQQLVCAHPRWEAEELRQVAE